MGHFSKECPTGGGNTCRNCGEEGHISKECDKPKNPENVTCRNCETIGHFSRDCPEPKDWSKVKCSQCGESKIFDGQSYLIHADVYTVGHTIKRCKNVPAEDADDGGFDGGDGNAGSGFDPPAGANGGDAWAGAEVASDAGGSTWGTAPPAVATVTAGGGEESW